jgi:RNA polymerase sigma factor (sigma-70 family)
MGLDSFFDVQFPFSLSRKNLNSYERELFNNFEENRVIKSVSANKNSEIIKDGKIITFQRFPSKNENLDLWIEGVDNIGGIKSFEEIFFEDGVEKVVELDSPSYFLDKKILQGHKRLIFMNETGMNFRNKIVEEYSRLIPHLYRKGNFNSRRTSFQDFFQEGILKLSNTLNYYSTAHNAKFFTFAYHCLEKSLSRKFKFNSNIRPAVNEAEERLLAYGGVEESQEFVSDARIDSETIFEKLKSFEKEILRQHYFEDKTFKEISDSLSQDGSWKYGTGRGNVNRVKVEAIGKLKKFYTF